MKQNDNYIHRHQYSNNRLRPVETFIIEWAKRNPDIPFCQSDFTFRYKAGTIRNAFFHLKKIGLIELCYRTIEAYYRLKDYSNLKQSAVTLTHMEGKAFARTKHLGFNFYSFIDSIELEEIAKVHDINLSLKVPSSYESARKLHSELATASKYASIFIFKIKWLKNRHANVNIHRTDSITIQVGCTNNPIETSIEGLTSLAAFLGEVRYRILELLNQINNQIGEKNFPEVGSWIVTQWHYGRDSKYEISGPGFNVTFRTWVDTLARIYTKKSGKKQKVRFEEIQTPKKTLPEAFEEKMQLRDNPTEAFTDTEQKERRNVYER